jgi:hypothetical protein
MIGSYRGTKNYIYLPQRNLVILIRTLEHEWYSIHDYIEGFYHYSKKNCQIFNNYLSRKTKAAVFSGGISNLGHFFWNEVQGIYNSQKEGLLDKIDEVVLYKYQYLDLDKIFPDFANSEISKPINSNEVFVKCLERSLFCIHPTAFHMTSDCAALIRKYSWEFTSPEHKKIIKDKKFKGIKIWFNLRSHNKVWINQVEGAKVICEYLLQKYKNVLIVLDGLPDTSKLVSDIEVMLGGKVQLIDCTNTTLENSISWACNVDIFVATIGSGLTINTWIAEKKGVAHSEGAHLGQLEMWRDVRHDIPLPLVPSHKQITDIGSGAYCDYSIDPKLILSLLKKVA